MRLGKRERLARKASLAPARARKQRVLAMPDDVRIRSFWDNLWPNVKTGLKPDSLYNYRTKTRYQREQA